MEWLHSFAALSLCCGVAAALRHFRPMEVELTMNGKTEKLLTFNANPRNLASLGQYIGWDEPTTQEVIQ